MAILPIGDIEIDEVRTDVAAVPTNGDNYIRRLSILRTWMLLLQRLGGSTRAYVPVDDRRKEATRVGDLQEVCRCVDEGFAILETARASLGTAVPVRPGPAPTSGTASPTDWPLYQGDIAHTGATADTGPTLGRVAWQHPVGVAWYSRPAVENGRVYAASPGMRSMLHCLDLESGTRLWRTRHPEVRFRGEIAIPPHRYHTRCVACSPVVLGDTIVLAELGGQANDDAARSFTIVDRESGQIVNQVDGGRLDYRAGYAAFAVSGNRLIHPHGDQRITTTPPTTPPQDRVACRDTATGDLLWDFCVGPVFSEPVVDEDSVYVGSRDGYLYCLSIQGIRQTDDFQFSKDTERLRWSFQAQGALNSDAVVHESHVIVGANDGVVYCLEKDTGAICWQYDTQEREERQRPVTGHQIV